MYRKRTDLAMEQRELQNSAKPNDPVEGRITTATRTENGIRVTSMHIPQEAENPSRRAGDYVTIEVGKVWTAQDSAFETAAKILAQEIRAMLPHTDGCTLVVGLGNDHITPDSIGPRVVSGLLVTRHLHALDPKLFANAAFGDVAAVAPGVLGQTGIESADIVGSITARIRPSCVIAIDALASRRLSRLASTVQLSNTGIRPGSGVSNTRATLSQETLGVPVLSIGVPTVVDAGTLAYDLLEELTEQTGNKDKVNSPAYEQVVERLLNGAGKQFFVTPRDSDVLAAGAARLIAAGINLALHDGLTLAEITAYLSA